MQNVLEIVNQFYEVSLNQKDADGIRPFLSEDFVFIGPMAETTGADQFIELNRQFLPAHVATHMQQQFVRNDEVCSVYELELRGPKGDLFTAPMADWVKIKDGKMVEQRIYYDPREFEKQMSAA